MAMMNPNRPVKRLGEILVQQRLITPAQLEEALLQQRTTREFLGTVLVRMGAVTPDTLLVALSQQFGVPYESVTEEQVDWAVSRQFPASAFSEGKCFPIRADASSVTVAIANPLDAWAMSEIEKAAGFRTVKPVLVSERDLQRLLEAYRARAFRHLTQRLDEHGRNETH
jgi:type IV pilus assembly protein PilB